MAVKIFICCAHQDELLLKKLKTHLSPLRRQGLIEIWHDRDISAGTDWEQEIKEQLYAAEIILLLVSPDFMDSDYINDVEVKPAMERHKNGEARVIPVILRPVSWQGLLGKLKALPEDGKPVMSRYWRNKDEAFFEIAEGIRKIAEQLASKYSDVLQQKTQIELSSIKSTGQTIKATPPQGNSSSTKESKDQQQEDYMSRYYAQKIAYYDHILKAHPRSADAHLKRGAVYRSMNDYERAINDYNQAILYNPHSADAYLERGAAYEMLHQDEKALDDYDYVIQHHPNNAMAYLKRGYLYHHRLDYEKALEDFTRTGQLDPDIEPRNSILLARKYLREN